VNGTAVTGFAPDTVTYTVNVPNATTAAAAFGTALDAKASVTSAGGDNLNVGDNTVTVTVTAEDPSVTKQYIVTVHRISANAALSDLLADGVRLAGFDSGTFTYTLNVPNATTSVVVMGTKADAKASITVAGGSTLAVGNNTVTVTVTAEDGTTVQTYRITVVRAKSNNAALSSLAVDGVSVEGFAPGKRTYEVVVPNATTSVTVTGMADDPVASIIVAGGGNLFVGSNTVTVTVTAQDNTTVVYTLTVKRLSADKSLTLLLALGGNQEEIHFTNGTLIARSVTNDVYSATVTGTVYDPATKLEINGIQVQSGQSTTINLQEGITTIPVKVTAQDLTDLEYTIVVTRYGKDQLTGLNVSGVTLSPTFDPGKFQYTGTVPYGVNSTTVTATVYGLNATLAVNGSTVQAGSPSQAIPLGVGPNTIQVNLTPVVGDSKLYTIVITRSSPIPDPPPSSTPSSPPPSIQMNLILGSNQKNMLVEVLRETTPSGRITDKVVMTPDIAAQALDGNTVRLYIPQVPEGSDEFNVMIPAGTLQVVNGSKADLRMETDHVQLTLPTNSVEKALQLKEELYFRFIPLRTDAAKLEIEKRVLSAQLVTQAAGNGTAVLHGQPMTIETNLKNLETRLKFPLQGMDIPSDPKKASEFLSSLRVYIEHSNGENELQKGTILYDDQGKPVSLEIVITHFSTFSVIELQKKRMDTVVYKSWIDGYPDGTFKPEQSITRAEIANILAKAVSFKMQQGTMQRFNDVPDRYWAADAIDLVQGAGLLNGYPDGSFQPDVPITRAEFAAIITRLQKLEVSGVAPAFNDMGGHWASGYVQAVRAAGLFDGYEDGSFRPDQPLTRAEAVKVMNSLLKRPTPELGEGKWKDVAKGDWFWLEVQSASKSFSYTRYEDGSNEIEILP
jgi:hypothetical protein